MKTAELRKAFLDYFQSKGHEVVQSSSLVPENDPTLLFSNAGMNQFKDLFLGAEKRDYSRATTSQKCMRISGKHNDFELVGLSPRHHTFFEMLGNFSFGDYFKTDAIKYGWEFVTDVLKLERERLWVTIFEEDDDAEKLWKENTDVNPDRILRLGESENFWAMGDTGPCGPCSEIHYFQGKDLSSQSAEDFLKDDGTYVEIWNLVFMQYDRSADGTLTPLPKPSVDTGMGLERVAAIMQGVSSNYHIDILREIIAKCEKLSGHKYDGSSFEIRDLREDKEYARDVAMRVIADHSRAAAFLIADGVHPGSDGRGYVLRRIIRRAIRHGKALGFSDPFMIHTTAKVIELMGEQYPELKEQTELIARLVDAEERKFHETLDAGLAILTKEVSSIKRGALFPGETAFLLHDTYGFPLDLTQDALKAYSLKVDVEAFTKAMEMQKARSREDRQSRDIAFATLNIKSPETKFLGYTQTESESNLTQIISDQEQDSFKAGDTVGLLFDTTPFYAESGGQVGDTGSITIGETLINVLDTQKVQDSYHLHNCKIAKGKLSVAQVGQPAKLSVDENRRNQIRAHHSATHLVHAALRKFLGDHVKQSGSRVDDHSMRFDYSHFEPVGSDLLAEVQSCVNQQIRDNLEVSTEEMDIDKATERGALAFFGEKYGDSVRVVQIGSVSQELCGGTHVNRSGDIGLVLISSDNGISAGVRRIECLAGEKAFEQVLLERNERSQIAGLLKSDTFNLPDKIEKLLSQTKSLEKELEGLKSKMASSASGSLVDRARTSPSGIKVIAETVEGADTNTLRTMVDKLRLKLGSGVVALGSQQGGNAIIVTGITSDLTKKLHSGKLVKEAALKGGGKGGGRPDFAQAGGVEPGLLKEALEHLFEQVS